MEVILVQDVDNLGKAGDQVRVRDGYCRNFLIPKRLAVLLSEGGLKFLQAKKKRAEEQRAQTKAEMVQVAERLKAWTYTHKAKVGVEGKLFGSVTRNDVHQALEKAGYHVEKHRIDLPGAIHQVGEYQVSVKLHPEVDATFKLAVVPE